MRVLAVLFALVAVAGPCHLVRSQGGPDARPRVPEKGRGDPAINKEEVGSDEIEVAEVMRRLRRSHEMWWAAGSAGNAELAAFHLHGMEGSMEGIIDADVVEDGVPLAPLMRSFGPANSVEKLEGILEREDVKAMHGQGAVLAEPATRPIEARAIPSYASPSLRAPRSVIGILHLRTEYHREWHG